MFGDFLSPIQLLVLLHEVGHVVDWARRYGPEETHYHERETLELERSANAFAMNVLRPSFIVNEKWKTDAVNILKYGSLHTYSKELVQKYKAGDLHMHRGDWDEYMYSDDLDE